MLIIVGGLIVFFSMLGGFMLAGGNPLVLLHVSEFVVIFGMAIGLLVIASPVHILKEIVAKIKHAMFGKALSRDQYVDLMKLLYELFLLGRRSGLIALEEHVANPAQSTIFSRYPGFLAHHIRKEFLLNALKPVIDGRIKPDQLENLMSAEIDAKEAEAEHPVHLIQLVGDSMPGIGIVAAVLGIINTMAAISDGPEVVGERVAAALTGTFLGIFAAYGFVNPMAVRIKANDAADIQYLRCIMISVSGFAKGLAPIVAIEVARRSLDHAVQPDSEELETLLKALPVPGKAS
ncbi:MAG: motility-associated protein [Opitutaceae bacterium]|jgi:chemotaxis protein MotA